MSGVKEVIDEGDEPAYLRWERAEEPGEYPPQLTLIGDSQKNALMQEQLSI